MLDQGGCWTHLPSVLGMYPPGDCASVVAHCFFHSEPQVTAHMSDKPQTWLVHKKLASVRNANPPRSQLNPGDPSAPRAKQDTDKWRLMKAQLLEVAFGATRCCMNSRAVSVSRLYRLFPYTGLAYFHNCRECCQYLYIVLTCGLNGPRW